MIKRLLLPVGKVHPGYIKFVQWSMVSNVIVSIETAITTHNMLSGLDYSNNNAYTTINYIGKDIIGQVGSLVYINQMSNQIDKSPDTTINNSNILQQVSFMLICSAPFADQPWFLPITGVANIMVNLSFIGYGAVNAICIKKISNDNNIGEIYSKITVGNTIASSIGLCIGVAFNTLVNDLSINCMAIPILGLFRIITIKKAVGILRTG